MSTKKGPPKHQNKEAWKFNKYRTDPKAKMLVNLQVINCCEKCTAVIEWKIKYGKYKTLTKAATCVDCKQKVVKYAYHTRCIPCVEKTNKCSKCGETNSQFVNLPEPSPAEIARLDAEKERELKALPERRRRTYLRFIRKLEKDVESPDNESAKQKLEEYKEKYARDDFDLQDSDLDDLSDSDPDDF